MVGNTLIVDLPDDLKQRLKLYCAKNGKTMSDEVIALLCQKLEQEAKEQDDGDIFGEIEPPFVKSAGKGLDIEAIKQDVLEAVDSKILPVTQGLEDLRTSLRDDFREWTARVASREQCKGLEEFVKDYNKKNSAIANFLENHIEILEKTSWAKRCDGDVKGLEVLRKEFRL